jgi:hypothetical protein
MARATIVCLLSLVACGGTNHQTTTGASGAAASCPTDARPGFVAPVPGEGDVAHFVIARDAARGTWDQPETAECVTQAGELRVLPHGKSWEVPIPAAGSSLTELGFGRLRFLAAIPPGETLTLASNPCSPFKLEGSWLDASEHSEEATPHEFCRMPAGWIRDRAGAPADCQPVPYAPSEVVFLHGECSAARAGAIRAACEDERQVQAGADCVLPGRAGYCSPVRIEGATHTAELFLAYGDRFAICLDARNEVVATLRL